MTTVEQPREVAVQVGIGVDTNLQNELKNDIDVDTHAHPHPDTHSHSNPNMNKMFIPRSIVVNNGINQDDDDDQLSYILCPLCQQLMKPNVINLATTKCSASRRSHLSIGGSKPPASLLPPFEFDPSLGLPQGELAGSHGVMGPVDPKTGIASLVSYRIIRLSRMC